MLTITNHSSHFIKSDKKNSVKKLIKFIGSHCFSIQGHTHTHNVCMHYRHINVTHQTNFDQFLILISIFDDTSMMKYNGIELTMTA